jgi:hypothetical protein
MEATRPSATAASAMHDATGVLGEVEGPAPAVHRFVERVTRDAPPLAAVARVIGECGAEGRLGGFPFAHGTCGGLAIDVTAGEELRVESMEVAEV